jgi:hypothetical protein
VSGFIFTPKDDAGHTGTPLGGSYVRVEDGEPANLLEESEYPVAARCKICREPIRLDRLRQMEWRHAPAEQVLAADTP